LRGAFSNGGGFCAALSRFHASQLKGIDNSERSSKVEAIPRGGRPHPFFLAQADDPVGSMTFLAIDDGTGLEPGLPQSLVSTPGQDLFWLAGTGDQIRH
jgi:hypothetical protein